MHGRTGINSGGVALIIATTWFYPPPARSEPAPPPIDTALTLYNQGFGVVRDTVPLDLKAGANEIDLTDVTAQLEPDSVILRDPSGQRKLRIIEQNYRNDAITQELLLTCNIGNTIDFLVNHPDGTTSIVRGKIIRGGPDVSRVPVLPQYYRYELSRQQPPPIVEVDGKLRFSLPGEPLFPGLPEGTLLKPTLSWRLQSDVAGPLSAELAYLTLGLNWEADYNVVAPEQGDTLEVVGWVTMHNDTGKTFENAHIKLMAGDVNHLVPMDINASRTMITAGVMIPQGPPVTEKSFDEYHLYTLNDPTTLRDHETKQVEFVRGKGIASREIFVYDGVKLDPNQGYNEYAMHQQAEYGAQSNKQVQVIREFKNSAANGLGIPLPKGRMRFYRRDSAGQLEFIGEDTIDHTPKDEPVTVHTGAAFDLVGERRQISFKFDQSTQQSADETFEIKLRNHKSAPVEIRVIEHLYRGTNWTITAHSNAFLKTDSKTIEFRVAVKPDEEKAVTYSVHYSW